jgi:hypothetical protein
MKECEGYTNEKGTGLVNKALKRLPHDVTDRPLQWETMQIKMTYKGDNSTGSTCSGIGVGVVKS